jgi:hypothetical protein
VDAARLAAARFCQITAAFVMVVLIRERLRTTGKSLNVKAARPISSNGARFDDRRYLF